MIIKDNDQIDIVYGENNHYKKDLKNILGPLVGLTNCHILQRTKM